MKRIETENSVWLFDEGLLQYMRMPKGAEAGPRPPEESKMVQDLEWLPYLSLERYWDVHLEVHRYKIMGPESVLGTHTGPVVKD